MKELGTDVHRGEAAAVHALRQHGEGGQTTEIGPAGDTILSIRDLVVEFPQRDYVVTAVDGASFDLKRGQRLGVVGESGSGKSTLAFSILGLLEPPARVTQGEMRFGALDLLHASDKELRAVRGAQISMIFQDALGSLNPVLTIGRQLREAIQLHLEVSSREATDRAVALLREVGIPNPEARVGQYPHEFSGGMRQRVMIAMALAADPQLLIADEPTTALDVTIQAEVIELLLRLSEERGLAVMLITHDLSLVAGFARDVLVMYAGAPVEYSSVDDIFHQPRHPYTRNLISAIPEVALGRAHRLATIPGGLPSPGTALEACRFQPRCYLTKGRKICQEIRPVFDPGSGTSRAACHFSDEVMLEGLPREEMKSAGGSDRPSGASTADPARQTELLVVDRLVKTFTRSGGLWRRGRAVDAVDDVSFHIKPGEALGLVGESGSGKTTVARLVLGLAEADAGRIVFEGTPTSSRRRRIERASRGRLQAVFQDPADSLNPSMTVAQIIAEPLLLQGRRWRSPSAGRVAELLDLVRLGPAYARRRPGELSGGQKQRVAIARALATYPALIVCDEPVSSLDVSVRAQILNLLMDLRDQLGIAYLFISHDLSVVRHVCDRVAVMYSGKIVELAHVDDLFRAPQHPYTIALMSAIPKPLPDAERGRIRIRLKSISSDSTRPVTGCVLAPRCWKAQDQCWAQSPDLSPTGQGHWSACYFPEGQQGLAEK